MAAPARTIFLGSGAFGLPILDMLVTEPLTDVVAVVTAPPRPARRHHRLEPSPIGARSAALDLPILVPERLSFQEAISSIAAMRPELLVLADYGRLVPPALLDLPRYGALNLHPSLLPRHRGATPIPAAILAGDRATGVTLMRMDEGLDTGPILVQRSVDLSGDEMAPGLEEWLSREAADLLRDALPAWLDGRLVERPQPTVGATITRPLRREDGRLDPSHDARLLERQVRAHQPWPGAWIETPGGRIAVMAARVEPAERGDRPAMLVEEAGGGLAMTTAVGRLSLVEVLPAGGRRMTSAELLRGRPGLAGASVITAPSAGSVAPR